MRGLLGVILALAVASPVMAADLSVPPRKTVHVHRHKLVRIHHLRVVRDYDGTPIMLRRRLDGTEDAYFAQRATPTRYLNGQPVTVYR
jgi:hypothetical protein